MANLTLVLASLFLLITVTQFNYSSSTDGITASSSVPANSGVTPGEHLNENSGVTPGEHWNENSGVTPGEHLNENSGVTPGEHLNENSGVTPGEHLNENSGVTPGEHLNENSGVTPGEHLNENSGVTPGKKWGGDDDEHDDDSDGPFFYNEATAAENAEIQSFGFSEVLPKVSEYSSSIKTCPKFNIKKDKKSKCKSTCKCDKNCNRRGVLYKTYTKCCRNEDGCKQCMPACHGRTRGCCPKIHKNIKVQCAPNVKNECKCDSDCLNKDKNKPMKCCRTSCGHTKCTAVQSKNPK